MRICIISDTHQLESELEIPPCDLLLSCGDWSFFGRSVKAMDAFNDWLGKQSARYITNCTKSALEECRI